MLNEIIKALVLALIGGLLLPPIRKYLEDRTAKLGKPLTILALIFVAIGILYLLFPVPAKPDLPATATSLALTSTKIVAQIDGTQLSGTSTAIAGATQTVVKKQALNEQATKSQSAKATRVADAILENGQLCSYSISEKNLSQGESDRNSNLILIVIGVGATVVFLVLAIQGRDERPKLIGFLSATILLMVVTGYAFWSYARHPLSSFPGNLQDSGYRQELLGQCKSQLTATSTFAATLSSETSTPTLTATFTPSLGASDTPKPTPAIVFNDLFENDQNNWRAQKEYYLVNVTGGFLNVQLNSKYPRGDFYLTCDACTLPMDNGNFVYEVVIGQSTESKVEPGFIFTASDFDEHLVNGYGVRLAGNGTVTLEKLGMAGGAIFRQKNPDFASVFGFQKVRIEVLNGKIKISVNDHLFTDNDFTVAGDHAGPHFGIYAFINDREIENSFKIDDIKISTNP